MSGPGLEFHAACAVTAGAGPVFIWQSGKFLSVARAGVGLYDLTFNPTDGIDATQCAITGNVRTAATALVVTVAHTSDTVKRVSIATSAGVATDPTAFDIIVHKRLLG